MDAQSLEGWAKGGGSLEGADSNCDNAAWENLRCPLGRARGMSSSEKSEAMLLVFGAVRQAGKGRLWLESRVNPRSGFAFASDSG